jgi:quercetin dioxygenase-like cupin family protein
MGGYKEVMPGVRVRFAYCSPELVVVETLLEQGATVPRHSHESTQVSIVLRGRLLLGLEGEGEKVVEPGGYTIIPSGVEHWAKALEETLVLDLNAPLTSDRRELASRLGFKCE